MSDNTSFDAGKAVDEIKKDRNLTILAGGAVALIVGLFLPWASWTIPSFSAFGVSSPAVSGSVTPGLGEGFSILLLICAVVAVGAALNVMKQNKKNMANLSVAAGILALVVTIANMPDTGSAYVGGSDAISTGFGFWLALAGSIALVVGAVMRMKQGKEKTVKKTEDK